MIARSTGARRIRVDSRSGDQLPMRLFGPLHCSILAAIASSRPACLLCHSNILPAKPCGGYWGWRSPRTSSFGGCIDIRKKHPHGESPAAAVRRGSLDIGAGMPNRGADSSGNSLLRGLGEPHGPAYTQPDLPVAHLSGPLFFRGSRRNCDLRSGSGIWKRQAFGVARCGGRRTASYLHALVALSIGRREATTCFSFASLTPLQRSINGPWPWYLFSGAAAGLLLFWLLWLPRRLRNRDRSGTNGSLRRNARPRCTPAESAPTGAR